MSGHKNEIKLSLHSVSFSSVAYSQSQSLSTYASPKMQFLTRITLIQIMPPTFFFIIKLTDGVKRIRQEWQSNGVLCTSDVQ